MIPVGLEGSHDKWIAEEVETIAGIYKKDPTNYELKDIPEKGQSRQYYLDKIKSLFENCKKDEGKKYFTIKITLKTLFNSSHLLHWSWREGHW